MSKWLKTIRQKRYLRRVLEVNRPRLEGAIYHSETDNVRHRSCLQRRNAEIADAHTSLTDAIRHLDKATTHGDELDRIWIAGIMRRLCDARLPLAEHLDMQAEYLP